MTQPGSRLSSISASFLRKKGLWVVTAMATVYAITFSYLAIGKYNSFHATYFDLGIETRVLWLTLHGGYNAYVQSGQNAIYTYPFTRMSFILALPVFAAYQSPVTLLVLESVLLGFAAIPLYFLTRKALGDELAGIFVAGSYLLSFDIQGANLFDYHPENFFPLIFFTAVASWVYGRKLIFIASMAAGSLIDPLVSLTLFLFLTQLILREVLAIPRNARSPNIVGFLRSAGHRLIFVARRDYHVTFAVVFLLAANAVAFYVSWATGELSHSPTGVSFTVAGFSSELSDKLLYIFTLVGPMLLIFLFDPLFTTVILGFLAYTFATDQPNPILIFGGAYPVMVIPPLIVASVFGVYRLIDGKWYVTGRSISQAEPNSVPSKSPRAKLSGNSQRRARRLCEVLCVSALAFALLFSPLSFYSPDLSYDGSSGPQNVRDLTSSSSAAVFLQKVVDLVPESGSVLTQNNIPQLSARYEATTFDVAPPGLRPDYVLADSNVNYYSNFAVALPWLQNFLGNESYGILGEGEGAMLLEKGYTGTAVLFAPYNLALNASQFSVFSGSNLTGGIIIHNGSSGPAQYVWYGPYYMLPPGNYTAAFEIRIVGSTFGNQSLITLDVVSGPTVFASLDLNFSEIHVADEWIQEDLSFRLTNYTPDMEFRGIHAESSATIEFKGANILESAA